VGPTDEGEVAQALLAEVRRFGRSIDSRAADREARLPNGVLDRAASLGLFGLTIPPELGGLGLSLGMASRAVAALATFDRSVAITVGLHAGLGTRGLVAYGVPSLQDEHLPDMASGACIGAFAATEAGAGSDLTAIRTVLRETPAGLVLEGEKSYVTNGGFAGLFTVLASSPSLGAVRGHTLVCVPAGVPGVAIGREEEKLGIRASSTVTVRFDQVRVPRDHVLGEPGRGMEHASAILAWGRTIMAAGCVGTARAALCATIQHVTSRRQSRRTLGSFGATREHVVSMAARLHAMDALVQYAAACDAGSLDGAALVAKVFCSEEAFWICDRALQLHGALGFLEPIGIARMLRDCRVTRIFEGANDVLLIRLGTARLASRQPFARDVAPACRTVASRLDAVADLLRARYGVTAVRRQTMLQLLAQAEVDVVAAHATCTSMETSADPGLASFAVDECLARAQRHLDGLAFAEAREERVTVLSDALYGVPTGRNAVETRTVSP
jgi:alkylation response protein AidB-like acyl-CoA dehydrogenase